VTLLLVTWNAGAEFPGVLRAMREQRLGRPYEILVIDSGSTDGTLGHVRSQRGVRLIEIPQSSFDHGLTRQHGVEEARGEVVVLATQDARPADELWLAHLVRCFDDPRVAGAYSRQLVRTDANPFIRERLREWAAASEVRRVQAIADHEEFAALSAPEKLQRVTFDNVSSAVRRSVALEIPFRACRFGEDVDWSLRVLLAGHRIVYEPRSRVIHSHNRPLAYEFRRIYADHRQLHRLLELETVPRLGTLAWRTGGGTLRLLHAAAAVPGLKPWERLSWGARALPWAFGQTLAQYLAPRAGRGLDRGSRWYRWLDRLLGRGL
jgi:rhamnosyltransferase